MAKTNTEIKPESKVEMSIPIKLAFLHQAITWPGVAGAETTLSDAKIKGIKMTLIPQGLMLEKNGKRCLIPNTNVVNYVLES